MNPLNRKYKYTQFSPLKCCGVVSEAKNLFVFFLIILLSLLSSCKNQQKIVINKEKERCLLDYKNAKTLTSHLKNKEFVFDRLNGKLSVEAEIDSTSHSFSVSLRIKKDSIIWLSISKLGIEGARILISKDSVRMMNRINNTYFIGDFSYLSKLLNSDLDFELLQSLLVGNSVEYYDEDEKIKAGVDNCQYFLGTIRKRKLKKAEKGKDLKEPSQSIFLIPETYKIARVLFFEFNPDRSFDANFSDFKKIDSVQLFPQKINCNIKAQKKINIQINYNKITLNEEQSFPFKIPDSYEKMVYKEKQ